MSEQNKLHDALSDPFPENVLGWKPQAIKNNRALAIAFLDARAVMDRLDEAVGPENWQDVYTVLPEGNVVCRLSLRIGGEWISKEDVGGESDQPDEGDKRKASFSDALKRAAVKWGVGRYLYSLPAKWVDYDPQKKQLTGTPQLPDWALPAGAKVPAKKPAPARHSENPATGKEFLERLVEADAAAVRQELCQSEGVKRPVLEQCRLSGLPSDPEKWDAEQLKTATNLVRVHFAALRAKKQKQPAA